MALNLKANSSIKASLLEGLFTLTTKVKVFMKPKILILKYTNL